MTGVFRGFAVGDTVTVSSERSPHDGRQGKVVGTRGGRILVDLNGMQGDYGFHPHELVKG